MTDDLPWALSCVYFGAAIGFWGLWGALRHGWYVGCSSMAVGARSATKDPTFITRHLSAFL
jgi:hypothetical protein